MKGKCKFPRYTVANFSRLKVRRACPSRGYSWPNLNHFELLENRTLLFDNSIGKILPMTNNNRKWKHVTATIMVFLYLDKARPIITMISHGPSYFFLCTLQFLVSGKKKSFLKKKLKVSHKGQFPVLLYHGIMYSFHVGNFFSSNWKSLQG